MRKSMKQFAARSAANGESLNQSMEATVRSFSRKMTEHEVRSSKNGSGMTSFRLCLPPGFIGTPKVFQSKASIARGPLAITPESLMLRNEIESSIVQRNIVVAKFAIGFLLSVNAPTEESALYIDDEEQVELDELHGRMVDSISSPETSPEGTTVIQFFIAIPFQRNASLSQCPKNAHPYERVLTSLLSRM